ncbi:MAG: MBL fold metallo-hydrolase [Thermoplasmata archaeon]|nr:MAG: MBL fold metallo-hydrolase [Thermoplasmata archaeon]
MRIRFLGGVDEVGRLAMILEDEGTRMLFDYGLSATDPPKYPMQAPPVDYLFLSHSHLDHSGMVPWVCGRYETTVLSTVMTQMVSEVLFEDNAKISDMEGYPQMYDDRDIRAAQRSFDTVKFGDEREIGPFGVIFHYAGHIPGATMFELRGRQTVLFTGDINTINTRLLTGTEPVKCDTLIIEGTYAGRNHPKRARLEYDFLQKVDEVVQRGGKVIIPAFAIGRTQEIMLLLKNSKYQIYVDGMGNSVTEIYLKHPEFLRSPKELRRMKNRVKMVRTFRGRKYAMKGDVIITTSGMLDGGPVLSYIEAMKDNPKNAILLTGYQVEGTNGRLLMNEKKIDIQGVAQRVNCEVAFFDFSAHSGHRELIDFIHGCEPENVIICHSDNRESIAEELKGSYNFYLPKLMEEIEL